MASTERGLRHPKLNDVALWLTLILSACQESANSPNELVDSKSADDLLDGDNAEAMNERMDASASTRPDPTTAQPTTGSSSSSGDAAASEEPTSDGVPDLSPGDVRPSPAPAGAEETAREVRGVWARQHSGGYFEECGATQGDDEWVVNLAADAELSWHDYLCPALPCPNQNHAGWRYEYLEGRAVVGELGEGYLTRPGSPDYDREVTFIELSVILPVESEACPTAEEVRAALEANASAEASTPDASAPTTNTAGDAEAEEAEDATAAEVRSEMDATSSGN